MVRTLEDKSIRSLERFLVGFDAWPWSAISRVGFGLALPPLFRALSGNYDSVWLYLALFVVALVALRLVPAVLRLALPFTVEARKIWAERRTLAKRYDSYQWQKLFWIGLGLFLYVIIAGNARNGETVLATICLIGGGVGLLMWRKANDMRSTQ